MIRVLIADRSMFICDSIRAVLDKQGTSSDDLGRRLTEVRPDLPRELVRLVARALAAGPEDRPTATSQVAELDTKLGPDGASPRRRHASARRSSAPAVSSVAGGGVACASARSR